MTRRLSSADLAAAAAAGVALWFTRASLDVFADGGRPVRVAMLPAPVELPGLVAVAGLAVFCLRTALARRGHDSRGPQRAEGPPDLLLPLVSLLAIAIPYLPWLADTVPAWRTLAGPLRLALWAVVCGQVLWIGIDALGVRVARTRARAVDDAAASGRWPSVIVFLTTAAACAWLAGQTSQVLAGTAAARDAAPLSLPRLVLAGAMASTLVWRLAARAAPSRGEAALVWLTLCGSATFLLGGVFRATTFPAVLCVGLASAWRQDDDGRHGAAVLLPATALALLPWLHVGLLPLALVLAGCLAWRARTSRSRVLLALAPVALSAGAAAVSRGHAWLTPVLPGSALWAAAAAVADQQDGVLIYAPALIMLTVPGLWLLWREGGEARAATIEVLAASAAALIGLGWQDTTRLTVAVPGAPLAPVLPLLALPIARWLRAGDGSRGRVALGRALALWGVVATALLVLARDGLVLLRGRDGASALLDWLEPSRGAVRLTPIAPPASTDQFAFVALTLVWLGVAAALVAVVTRFRRTSDGAAAVAVIGSVAAAATIGATVVDATLGSRVAARVDPALRVESRMLAEYDARRRPLAIAYDLWRPLDATAVPGLFAFQATPGARRHPQPLRVLLNARLSLPAGEYALTLRPGPGAALAGSAGLQVGRIGPPMRTWHLAGAPGAPWSERFTLPVDASFVGVRAEPRLEASVQELRITPARVVNASDRRDLPPVVSSGVYGGTIVTFHSDAVYPEHAGFWVRGRSTLLSAFTPPAAGRDAGVRLSLHAGPASTRVRFETAAWESTLLLEPGVSREVSIPARGEPPFPVRIRADAGFVPADASGGTDRRFLGCWIEVLQ